MKSVRAMKTERRSFQTYQSLHFRSISLDPNVEITEIIRDIDGLGLEQQQSTYTQDRIEAMVYTRKLCLFRGGDSLCRKGP